MSSIAAAVVARRLFVLARVDAVREVIVADDVTVRSASSDRRTNLLSSKRYSDR